MNITPEQVALSDEDVVALLQETEANFDVAFENCAEVPVLTVGTLAIFLIDGLVDGVQGIEPEAQRQALLIEELANCLTYLAVKYASTGEGSRVH